MSAVGLLREQPDVADDDIAEQMSGNLCRCAAYQNINAAVRAAREDR
jgi:xanthine dehydrogenase YagT iron-sulfur-binding subunit